LRSWKIHIIRDSLKDKKRKVDEIKDIQGKLKEIKDILGGEVFPLAVLMYILKRLDKIL